MAGKSPFILGKGSSDSVAVDLYQQVFIAVGEYADRDLWDQPGSGVKLCCYFCGLRYKLMKWWAQSFLVGVPKIVCGFRDDDGIVKNMQYFKTSMIPHDSQVITTQLWYTHLMTIMVVETDFYPI